MNLVLNFIRASPRNVNAFTALKCPELTWDNFQKLVYGILLHPQIAYGPKAVILPPLRNIPKRFGLPLILCKQERITKPSKMQSLVPFLRPIKKEKL